VHVFVRYNLRFFWYESKFPSFVNPQPSLK